MYNANVVALPSKVRLFIHKIIKPVRKVLTYILRYKYVDLNTPCVILDKGVLE